MSRRMTVDPRCAELAEVFLSDLSGATAEDIADLAEAIQEACEDFYRDLAGDGCCRACGACPGFIGAECDETCEHAQRREGAAQ